MVHNVAIWGAGTMGRMHASCYERSGEARVAYVIDIDGAKAAAVASSCGATPTFDPSAALDDPTVDAIDVCLPTALHKEATERAARAGKHVLCEKPIALTPDDARAMIATCRARGVKLAIAHVLRYFPEYEMAHDAVTSGELGRIGVVRLSRVAPFPKGWADWFADEAQSGGVILDLSIHDFDFLAWCFGPVERIYARRVRVDGGPGQDGPDARTTQRRIEYALAVVRMKSGVIAHVEGSWGHPGPFRYAFEICGSAGMIEHDSLKAQPLSVMTAAGAAVPAAPATGATAGAGPQPGAQAAPQPGVVVPESPLRDREPYFAEIREFLAFLRGERRAMRVSPEDAVVALEICLAAIRSADSGKVVTLA